ncbi:hypothetical protein [Streptomyces lydicus]|uniref:hypothetical protein n=1 Tax=Streptomyces lydicus TaxID=47763 RepID=UPI0032202E39
MSESVTNALRRGVPPGRGFQLYVWPPAGGVLRLEVHDSGDGWPRVRTGAGPVGEVRHGLLLADKRGVGERMPGKAVRCGFTL